MLAAVTGGAGTLADGAAYQLVLGAARGRYGVAAAVGAVLGGVTNFLLNRALVFPGRAHAPLKQAALYALGSALTLAALEVVLFTLVGGLGLSERIAWVPGKVLAFALVSYPFQRFVVFAGHEKTHEPQPIERP